MTMQNKPGFSFCLLLILTALMLPQQIAFAADDGVLEELDAFWAEVSRTVAEGDFEAYKATYHPDAILVSGLSNSSHLISKAFAKWEQGFLDTRSGKLAASVEFRFTQRLNDDDTAHETGFFKYVATPADGEPDVSYFRFEALLIKQEGWKSIMEFQRSTATQAEWDAAL
jgi:ketosteroid isomerase-like protein